MRAGILGIALLAYMLLPAISLADICSYVDAEGVRHFSNGADCPAGSKARAREVPSGDLQADQNRRGLRFMGVYRAEKYYLRFYSDGTVISAKTTARPDQLAVWFGKSNKNLSRGQYSVDSQDTIRFYCPTEHGTVLYKGTLRANLLTVQSAVIDARRPRKDKLRLQGYRKFRFIPVTFAKDNLY